MDTTSIGVYWVAPPECAEYDPQAPVVAEKTADLIRAVLPEVVVEHVGSTAVPDCPGKGVIDLMLVYPERGLEAAKEAIENLGFQRQTTRDPFPEERPMRTGSIEHNGKAYRLHVHVLAADSAEVKEIRLFRDLLRSDPALRARYAARKQSIAANAADSIDYAAKKGEFVQEVLARERESGT